MSREYTKLLIEALDNGTISHEDVAKSFLTFLSEDKIQEFVESEFDFLVEEVVDAELDNSCEECGREKHWFIHNCQSNNQYDEMHGCPSCDDQCIFCS
jgi:hypothetical protein